MGPALHSLACGNPLTVGFKPGSSENYHSKAYFNTKTCHLAHMVIFSVILLFELNVPLSHRAV